MDLIGAIRRVMNNPDQNVRKPKRGKKKKKVKRKAKEPITYPEPVKVPKIRPGRLHVVGSNDSGQLGFDPAIPQCRKPIKVTSLENKTIKMVACGGKHTLVLDTDGIVWSFGSREKGVLGRPGAIAPEDCVIPGRVELPAKVKQVSAGDFHSAALTVSGEVYAWGCYKNRLSEDWLGIDAYLTEEDNNEYCERPWDLTSKLSEETEAEDVRIIKIVSGANHIAMLGDDARMYTCGAWDSGQLGREQSDPKRLTRALVEKDTGEPLTNQEYNLKPRIVFVGNKYEVKNIWAGRNATFCLAGKSNYIFAMGDNSCCQLGVRLVKTHLVDTTYVRTPSRTNSFNTGDYQPVRWRQIAPGDFHTVALTETGRVYTVGNHTKGRLGVPDIPVDEVQGDHVGPGLKLVPELQHRICSQIAAGKESGFALTIEGPLYRWGAGDYIQVEKANGTVLPNGEIPKIPHICSGIKFKEQEVMRINVGGEHVALTIAEKANEPKVQ